MKANSLVLFAMGRCKFGGKCKKSFDGRFNSSPPVKNVHSNPHQVGKSTGGKSLSKGAAQPKAVTKQMRDEMAQKSCPKFAKGRCHFGKKCFMKHGDDDKPLDRIPCAVVRQSACSENAFEDYALDTGTGIDVCRKGIAGSRVEIQGLPQLQTAGGIVSPTEAITTYIEGLGENAEMVEL